MSRIASGMRSTFLRRQAWLVLAGATLAYALAYLLIAKALVIDPSAHFGGGRELPQLQTAQFSWRLLTDWFNPAFALFLTDSVAFAPPTPVLATSLLLGALFGANLALSVAAMSRAYCGPRRPWWAISALPGFLASFSCCAPTVLLLLGANFAVAVVAIVPFVVPFAALLMLASVAWNAGRLGRAAAAPVPAYAVA